MKEHQVALWAAAASFFASLLTIGIFDLFSAAKWLNLLGAFFVAVVTAGGVYAKERLADAKKEERAQQKLPKPHGK